MLLLSASAVAQTQLDLDGLDRALTRLERRGMAAQVLVASREGILYERGVGTLRAVDPLEEPIGPETVFPLLSLTKPFTASTVLALAADGRIALDDPLGAHVHGLASPWADIPIHRLLTHTSGVSPEIANRAWHGEPRFEPVQREEFLARVQRFRPRASAETTFRYSNVGYGLLGVLIESVSDKSWEQYLHERLLALGAACLAGGAASREAVIKRVGPVLAGLGLLAILLVLVRRVAFSPALSKTGHPRPDPPPPHGWKSVSALGDRRIAPEGRSARMPNPRGVATTGSRPHGSARRMVGRVALLGRAGRPGGSCR